MKRFSLWIVVLAAAVLVLSACSPQSTEPTLEPQTTPQQGVIAEGRLLPVNSISHAFSLSGKVAEVLVRDGDAVTKGQVLARLSDSPEIGVVFARAHQEELAVQQALDSLTRAAELNLAEVRLAVLDAREIADKAQEAFDANETDENRGKLDVATAVLSLAEDQLTKLESGKGVDPEQLAAAEARLASAKAAVASAEAALDGQTLRAEIEGTVTAISIKPGQWITAGAPVLVIADFTTWVVKTDNLTELEITSVENGQQVEVVLDALPEVTLEGEVSAIDTRFEEKRGDITYTVTIRLNQIDPRLRWGMTAAVYFGQ